MLTYSSKYLSVNPQRKSTANTFYTALRQGAGLRAGGRIVSIPIEYHGIRLFLGFDPSYPFKIRFPTCTCLYGRKYNQPNATGTLSEKFPLDQLPNLTTITRNSTPRRKQNTVPTTWSRFIYNYASYSYVCTVTTNEHTTQNIIFPRLALLKMTRRRTIISKNLYCQTPILSTRLRRARGTNNSEQC